MAQMFGISATPGLHWVAPVGGVQTQLMSPSGIPAGARLSQCAAEVGSRIQASPMLFVVLHTAWL